MNIKSIIAIGLAGCSLLGGSIYAAGSNNNESNNSKSRTIVTIPAVQSNPSKDKTNVVLPKGNVLKADSVNSVKKNQQFYVVLSENASTGYTWSYKTNNKAIQLIDQKNILPSNKKIVGAPSQKVWTFKAIQPGTYKLQFSYARSWEKNATPAKTVIYTVEVK